MMAQSPRDPNTGTLIITASDRRRAGLQGPAAYLEHLPPAPAVPLVTVRSASRGALRALIATQLAQRKAMS